MSILAEPPSRANGRWTFRDTDNGNADRANPDDLAQMRRAARNLGVEVDALRDAQRVAEEVAAAPTEDAPSPLGVRGWVAGGEIAEFRTLDDALEAGPGRFVSWDGTGLCAVDVDITAEARDAGRGWSDEDVVRIARRAGPSPRYAWRSRSGGLRFIFGPDERYGLTALQRAGLHVLMHGDVYDNAVVDKVELIRVTRTPPEGSSIVRRDSDYGTSNVLGALLRDGERDAVPEAEIQEWLARAGLREGGRYEHTMCPMDPRETSGTDPVVVTQNGVQCFVCGRFWRWPLLVSRSGAALDNDDPEERLAWATRMAVHVVHWAHAELVLQAERPRADPRFLRAGYQALLRIVHAQELEDDPDTWNKRIAGVWRSDLTLVRGGGGVWLRRPDYAAVVPSRPSAAAMPWTRGSAHRIDTALGNGPMRGFPEIEPVLHLVGEPRWFNGRVRVPDACRVTAESVGELTVDEAEDFLRDMLPGVQDSWLRGLRVLVVGALYAQLNSPQPPMTVIQGRSGVGKGALVAALTGIVGRDNAPLLWQNEAELQRAIGMGLEARAPVLWGDEVGKSGPWWYHSGVFLRMSKVHAWRKLYVGMTLTPVRAITVLAGSTLPGGMVSMPELARRACLLRLDGEGGMATAGWMDAVARELEGNGLQDMRDSALGAAIAEAYIRWARPFVSGSEVAPWGELAISLGAEQLESSDESREIADIVLQLYEFWRAGDDTLIYRRRNGRASLRCWRNGVDDAVPELLADYIDPQGSMKEQKAKLAQLETFVPVRGVSLVVRSVGSRPRIAFVSDEDPDSDDRRNEELFPAPEGG